MAGDLSGVFRVADPLSYTLEVRGITGADADAVAEFLIRFGAASPPERTYGFPLDGLYSYDRAEKVAHFGKSEETVWPDSGGLLAELSGYHPDAVFVLDTRGHEEDMGRAFFKGGLHYEATPEIVFPEFDAARLR